MIRKLITLSALTVSTGLLLAASAFAAPEDQLIAYYRKKNNLPPAAKVTVDGLKDSATVKGAKEGTLVIGEGPGAKRIGFLASPDLRYVSFATVEDITVDPSKAVMAKIDLKGQPFKGGQNAKVTVVEYSDFQCPFCKRGYDTVENQVLKEYGDKVKFYFKHYPLPFHPWAEPAHVAAECAKEQKADAYWKLYKDFFEHQADVNPQNVKDKATEYLKDTGVDMAKWGECFDGKKSLPSVKAQMAEGQSVGVTGTPGFIINGRLLSGAQPFEKFKDVIDDELAQK